MTPYLNYSAPVAFSVAPLRRVPAVTVPARTVLENGKLVRFDLDPEIPDAVQILSVMREVQDRFAVDPVFRTRAILIAQPRRGNDVPAIIRNIVEWCRAHFTYLADPLGPEFLIEPLTMLNEYSLTGQMHGDCDDIVLLLTSLFSALGIPAKARAVRLPGAGELNHVVAMVSVQGEWEMVDLCNDTGGPTLYEESLELA